MKPDEWFECLAKLPPHTPDPRALARLCDFHARESVEAEREGNRFALRFHLNKLIALGDGSSEARRRARLRQLATGQSGRGTG